MSAVRIVLPGIYRLSWNPDYAGRHWAERRRAAQEVHAAVRAAAQDIIADLHEGEYLFVDPVVITTVTYLDKHPLIDADNIQDKLFIDGLKGWAIVDDRNRYVRGSCRFVELDKANPRVEIIIKPYREGEYYD